MVSFKVKYHSLRNVTSPEDEAAGRTRRCGIASADEFFELPDDDNVREFLEEEVKKRGTRVNDAMRDTLENERDLFGILNGGITLTSRSVSVDDKAKVVTLVDPSIVNGSQTRGVLRKFFSENPDDTEYPSVSFELIESDDEELHAKISIARNFQNQVAPVSVYGRKGLFNDLEAAMQARDSTIRLRKSETDVGNDVIDTEKLIQVITVCVPQDILMPRPASSHARPYAFSQKAVCLKDFDAIMGSKTEDGKTTTKYPEARQFFLEVAYDVWQIYEDLNTRDEFSVFRQRKNEKKYKSPVKKSKDNQKVIDVAQGIKFPIMSAVSLFAEKDKKKVWRIAIPEDFDFQDLVDQAAITYNPGPGLMNPAHMGKTVDCYMSLAPVVNSFLKYSRRK